MRRRMIAFLLGSVSSLGLVAPPAHALLGVGDVVIDPTNLVQNMAAVSWRYADQQLVTRVAIRLAVRSSLVANATLTWQLSRIALEGP